MAVNNKNDIKRHYALKSAQARAFAELKTRIEQTLSVNFGINTSSIDNEDVITLKYYLKKINEIIDNSLISQSYAAVIKTSEDEPKIIFAENGIRNFEEADYVINIPVQEYLLEIKKRLIARIGELEGEEKIENIRDLLKKVQDGEVQQNLEKELDELQEQSQRLREQVQETESQQASEKAKEEWQLTLRQRKAEVRELEWKVWRSLIERESVSTIIGALLLIVIVIALIIAMFNHVASPEILNNAFLVILGYFFGQTVGKVEAKNKPDNEKS